MDTTKNCKKKHRLDIRKRLFQVIMWDREIEGGMSRLSAYIKNGKCLKSLDSSYWI